MKLAKVLSLFFAMIAVLMVTATAIVYAHFRGEPPMIQLSMDELNARTDILMEAICRGDYSAASASLYGSPELQWDHDTAAWLSTRLWSAYSDSITYAFSGPCYATNSGIFRDVTITVLDVPALSSKIEDRFQLLLEPYLTVSRYDPEINEEDGSLRQEFIADVLHQAVEQILSEDNPTIDFRITLELTFKDGQWWVIPQQPLIDIISGTVTHKSLR